MEKRKAENMRVKRSITDALFALMREKSLSDILDLCRSGFSFTLLEELNRFHESAAGTMAPSSMERYQLYAYIGALLNTALVWLSEDVRTGPKDMARYFWQRQMTAAGRS